MNEFEYVGGRIWSLEEPNSSGYNKTVLSVEIENGKAVIVDQGRILSDEENTLLIKLLKEEGVILGRWKS